MSELLPIHIQVNVCATLLGEAIARSHGDETLALVETLRHQAAQARGVAEKEVQQHLLQLLDSLGRLTPGQTLCVAKAFSVYLVLINACENAYRTSRLKTAHGHEALPLGGGLVYVLTAHPTEVRSAPAISLGRRITSVLVSWFGRGPGTPPLPVERRQLSALIGLLWRVGIHKRTPVTPAEEVDHIAGQFSDEILTEIFSLRGRGADLRFRTWVGGDKDGHPGITATTLHTSFRRTRQRFYLFFRDRLLAVKEDLLLLDEDIRRSLEKVEQATLDVRRVTAGDGIRMTTLRHALSHLCRQVERSLGQLPLKLVEMSQLLVLFPGMVLPVEMREESTVFLGLKKKRAIGVIGKMLRKARAIAEGGDLHHYIQGLIVSMTRSAADLEAAADVAERAVGSNKIRIIPLFERGEDLDGAPETVDAVLSGSLPFLVRRPWEKNRPLKMEIMLGYSDTAKRMGAFASRRRIFHAMDELTGVCRKHNVEPIFFHGSGGSVTRGGGSIEEQFAAWPESARKLIKLTLQGEMVERTLATPEIFRRGVERLLTVAVSVRSAGEPSTLSNGILEELALVSQEAFKGLVEDDGFRRFVAMATPYPDLSVLHLGSRPSHRPGKSESSADLGSLRAIPWVLCFTQVRLLVPSWYGIGTAYMQLRRDPDKLAALQKAFETNQAFKAFIKLMGFSLAKGDRAVFSLFASQLAPEPEMQTIKEKLMAEERRVMEMVKTLSGKDHLLWFRPWLSQSILLRGSTIHPLSLIQLAALQNRRQNVGKTHTDEILRSAIAGVAVGMLTTG